MRFGRLTVYRRELNSHCGHVMLACKCACGTEKIINKQSIVEGRTRSCGCLSIEISTKRLTTHGASSGGQTTPEFDAWRGMKARCLNLETPDYHNYGGRGIRVCDEWLHSFETFYRDMGDKPSSTHSLDRIDSDKDYCRTNCRWATKHTQGRNRRGVKINEEIAAKIRHNRANGVKRRDTIVSLGISLGIYKAVISGKTWKLEHAS